MNLIFVDHEHAILQGILSQAEESKSRYKIVSQIKELKTCAVEVKRERENLSNHPAPDIFY